MTEDWDIEDEWESVPMEKNEDKNEEINEDKNALPEGCMERVSKQAERNNMTEDKVLEIYFTYIKEAYGCDDPYSETDEELLNDWFESCFTKERRSGGGSSNTVSFVGHFVGKDNSKKDRSEWVRNNSIKLYTENPGAIIETGKIGIYEKQNNVN